MLEMKNEKKLHGFSFSINMANFEAFRCTKKLISNLFFLKSVRFIEFFSMKEIELEEMIR